MLRDSRCNSLESPVQAWYTEPMRLKPKERLLRSMTIHVRWYKIEGGLMSLVILTRRVSKCVPGNGRVMQGIALLAEGVGLQCC